MKHEIKCRNDQDNPPFGHFKDKKGIHYSIGEETFILHKIGGSVMDCDTGFRWEDDSDILEVVHTDANGKQVVGKKDMKDYNTTVKEVIDDINHILDGCAYRAKNNIEIHNVRY